MIRNIPLQVRLCLLVVFLGTSTLSSQAQVITDSFEMTCLVKDIGDSLRPIVKVFLLSTDSISIGQKVSDKKFSFNYYFIEFDVLIITNRSSYLIKSANDFIFSDRCSIQVEDSNTESTELKYLTMRSCMIFNNPTLHDITQVNSDLVVDSKLILHIHSLLPIQRK